MQYSKILKWNGIYENNSSLTEKTKVLDVFIIHYSTGTVYCIYTVVLHINQ
mgnify:CR=1 FL=1